MSWLKCIILVRTYLETGELLSNASRYILLQTCANFKTNEPLHEKINNLVFRPGPTQIELHSHRSRLEP